MNAGELVPYTTAEELAATYRDAVAKIRDAANVLSEQAGRLQAAFMGDARRIYDFQISLHYRSRSENIDAIIEGMKLAAWGAIIERLNIRRLMSSKRIQELDEALDRRSQRSYRSDPPPAWPEITPETIIAVAKGYIASATEFLEEAVAEEYAFWRPNHSHADYKRNSDWKLNRKIIRPYIVEHGYGSRGSKYRCNYTNQSHVVALDNIFHMLDGKGPVEEYKGELAGAIDTSASGSGETSYFKFKGYGNGNLHLEFKRLDLLALFNQIASKSDRIGQERKARAG